MRMVWTQSSVRFFIYSEHIELLLFWYASTSQQLNRKVGKRSNVPGSQVHQFGGSDMHIIRQ